MQSVRSLPFICSTIFLLACTNKTHKAKSEITNGTKNHFPNIIQVKQFGDTMRLEVEKQGNGIIKHYIDLKGTQGDNFDDSYNVECYYERRDIDSTVLIDNKKVEIKALLTENYKTEFSGGKNFYFITSKGDTVFSYHSMDYIQ